MHHTDVEFLMQTMPNLVRLQCAGFSPVNFAFQLKRMPGFSGEFPAFKCPLCNSESNFNRAAKLCESGCQLERVLGSSWLRISALPA